MKYKKTIILLALVVFLLSIAGVSASEIDNTIASENANTIELSTDNDIEDNLQTSEENEALASTDHDEAIAQTDTEILGADSAKYSDLANEINQSGNITLTHKSYTYDEGETITIHEDNKVIDGNGAVIDMNGSTIMAFYISGSDVTIKNLTIINANYDGGDGGAIYFSNSATSGTVTNCNFTNNKATRDYARGGAVFFYDEGTVTNCNFINNKATGTDSWGGAVFFNREGTVSNCNFSDNTAYCGGAVYFLDTGNVTNCNFTGNNATGDGSAVYFWYQGTVSNCNFTGNNATGEWGGAVYFFNTGSVSNCNFTDNTATYYGGAIYFLDQGTVTNCNFTDNTANFGGSVFFNLKGNVTNCNFAGNNATGEGGAINMGFGTVSNCNFAGNNATGDGGAIYFLDEGTVTNCNFTDNTARYGGAIFFLDEGTVTNCNFTNNTANRDGGAINMGSGTVSNCNFTGNTASRNGGAVYFYSSGNVTNCNFTDNTASGDGGAVYFLNTGSVSNCNFTGNNATNGSAIYFYNYKPATKTVSNSRFLNNRANAEALEITKNDNNITITFTGRNNLLNAIYSRNDAEVTFTNVTYWGSKGITNTGNSTITLSGSNKEAGQNITVGVIVNDELVLDKVYVTDENGAIVLNINVGENYYIGARHNADSYYTDAVRIIAQNIKKFYANVTSISTNNKTVNITAKSNILNGIIQGKLLFILPNGTQIDAIYGANGTWWAEHTFDDYGEYNVNATYVGLDNVTVNNGTITINKVNSTIALDNIVLDYGESANVTVTTTGATGITANINGTDVTVINNYTIPISGLGAGNYILTVTTIADDNHNPVTKEVTITVNKVSTEITLANETLDLKVNDEFAVLADLTPAGAGNLTYSSSNESVVKVSDEGLITALSEGTSIVTVSFAGNDNYTVAQNKTINVTVSLNDASVSAEDITLDIGANATIGAVSVPEGLKVTYIPDNSGVVTVENGVVTAVKEGTAKITLKVGGDGIYAENSTTITVTVNKINATVDVLIPENVTVGDNSTVNVVLPEDATGNVTVKVDGEVVDTVPVKDGSADVTIPSMSAGNHTVNVSYSGDDNYKSSSKTATLSVAKDSTNLTAANVTATYNINKYLVITLKDSKGNPLANSTVTVDLNGAKNYTTDENGQVKVKVSNLVPKTYSAKITFDGNGNYLGFDATAKVVVKKATPKITANAKTFKTTTKTKKYTITLKDNTGKAIKNAKVYLKVNGKTYKATTNSKGKATFKITKLDKKGTFKATITYKGSKYYNKVTKKANIKVISTWKTISKGSKLKSTVKEIQRALKNNGYYLTAYGHYLMVDGIYWDHTVNAVKQFQKAKGLKVTGKVDEKTAKKLGII